MRYFIQLSYNGSSYHGWQIQPNAVTVQETIQDALSKLLNTNINLKTQLKNRKNSSDFSWNEAIREITNQ